MFSKKLKRMFTDLRRYFSKKEVIFEVTVELEKDSQCVVKIINDDLMAYDFDGLIVPIYKSWRDQVFDKYNLPKDYERRKLSPEVHSVTRDGGVIYFIETINKQTRKAEESKIDLALKKIFRDIIERQTEVESIGLPMIGAGAGKISTNSFLKIFGTALNEGIFDQDTTSDKNTSRIFKISLVDKKRWSVIRNLSALKRKLPLYKAKNQK